MSWALEVLNRLQTHSRILSFRVSPLALALQCRDSFDLNIDIHGCCLHMQLCIEHLSSDVQVIRKDACQLHYNRVRRKHLYRYRLRLSAEYENVRNE